MARSLPTKPSLTQFKKQAKNSLKAHGRGEERICDTLRLLRRFTDASDEEVLAADVGLQEVQHALAKDYGFENWAALRAAVGAEPTKLTDRVQRKGGRVWIDRIERFAAPGWWCAELYCQAELGKLAGVDVTQDYLAGITGAAFALVFHPAFCPSSPDMILGPADGTVAQKLIGFRVVPFHGHEPDDQVRKSIAESIDRGIPAVAYAGGGAFGLVVGYEEDGRKLYGRTFVDKTPDYTPVPDDGPWFTRIMTEMPAEERGPGLSERELAVQSLRLAVKVANQESSGAYACGFKAFEVWAEGLLDDARFEGVSEEDFEDLRHANGWCYVCVAPSRQAAVRYLRDIEVHFTPRVSGHVLKAAGIYEQVARKLTEGRKHVPWEYPVDDEPVTGLAWTKGMRHAQAKVLRDCLALERKAVAEIEKALAAVADTRGQEDTT